MSARPPKPPGLPGDPIAFQVMTEIGIIAQLAETLMARELPGGLTPAQFGVLNHLLRLEVQQTVSELASAFQVSAPTMSSTVRKLEDKGYVTLLHDADDRRVRRVAVTPAGAQMRRQSVMQLAPLAARMHDTLPEERWAKALPFLTELRVWLDGQR